MYGQSEPLEKKWIKADSVFIAKLVKAYKINPISLEKLLAHESNRKQKLGFDYYIVESGNGVGYVSIFYRFVYHKNKLISYRLDPQMPNDARLVKRYLKFYARLFKIDKDNVPEPIYYGYEEVSKPLNNFKGLMSNDSEIQFFMTPYSGIVYGDYGGFANKILDNRAMYLKIKRKITPDICELLLYSENPATRLTSIEYYYQHPNLFTAKKERIEARINLVFNELPSVLTMSVDQKLIESAKELVNRFVKKR